MNIANLKEEILSNLCTHCDEDTEEKVSQMIIEKFDIYERSK